MTTRSTTFSRRAARRIRAGLGAVGFAAAASVAQAAPTMYAVTFDDQLISIDLVTGAGTLIGNIAPNAGAVGLGAYGGKLYTYDQRADRLLELNRTTGATVASYDLGLPVNFAGEGGLDFRSDGTGFLNSAFNNTNAALYSFSIGGPASLVGTTNNFASLDGLAFDDSDVLYALGQTPSDNLYTVDAATSALSLVGATGVPSTNGVGGLDFVGGTLYAMINDGLYTIDKATGAATLIGQTGFSGVSGLASLDDLATVPLPSSLALAVLGLGLMAFRRRSA